MIKGIVGRLCAGLLLMVGIAPAQVTGGQLGKERRQVPKTLKLVTIDGRIEEDAWRDALIMELKYEVRPGENVAPPVRTEMFITYTEDHLLVAFKCYDTDPSQIRARFNDRDNAWDDDWVGIALDTFNDQRRAYELICNPLGVQIDALNDDMNGNYDDSWNAIWDSAGRITDEGYEVEMSIPFNQLRFQTSDEPQTWGVDGFRSFPRRHRYHIGLFPRDRAANSYLGQTVKIEGFSGADPGRNLEVVPTATSFRSDIAESSGGLAEGDTKSELGLTARWGITPNLTLNGTLNPDFSQVEADAVQLDINEQFALFFDETRPFFLEGADYFNTRINLLHTRTIVDPSTALKVTGKQGVHTYGVFTAVDEKTQVLVPASEGSATGSFDFESNASVGRYRYDFGRNSSVGAMFTNREGDGYYNRVLSIDASYRFTEQDLLSLNLASSQTRYNQEMEAGLLPVSAGEKLRGEGFSGLYRHSARNWNLSVSHDDFGREFRTDLGFIPQVDYSKTVAGGEYIWYGEPGAFYNVLKLGSDWDETKTQDGELLERELETWFIFNGPLQTEFVLDVGHRTRTFNSVSFEQDFQNININITPTGSLFFSLNANLSDWIDFAHIRPAKRHNYTSRLRFNLGKHLNTVLDYSISDLDVAGGTLFTANVAQSRVNYQFNNRTLFRAIVQYTEVERDTALYANPVAPKSEDLFAQLLFSYKLNAQTVAFLGYTDSHEGVYENQDVAFGDYGLVQQERTFFLKVGYAWVR